MMVSVLAVLIAQDSVGQLWLLSCSRREIHGVFLPTMWLLQFGCIDFKDSQALFGKSQSWCNFIFCRWISSLWMFLDKNKNFFSKMFTQISPFGLGGIWGEGLVWKLLAIFEWEPECRHSLIFWSWFSTSSCFCWGRKEGLSSLYSETVCLVPEMLSRGLRVSPTIDFHVAHTQPPRGRTMMLNDGQLHVIHRDGGAHKSQTWEISFKWTPLLLPSTKGVASLKRRNCFHPR